jgi:hypothetical protein
LTAIDVYCGELTLPCTVCDRPLIHHKRESQFFVYGLWLTALFKVTTCYPAAIVERIELPVRIAICLGLGAVNSSCFSVKFNESKFVCTELIRMNTEYLYKDGRYLLRKCER